MNQDIGEMHGWGDIPPEARTEIERLIPEGKRIDAIRAYRRHTDVTLKEAKEAVDSLAAGMGIEFSVISSPVRSCWVVALAFLAWMGLIAAMPFLAKFVLTEHSATQCLRVSPRRSWLSRHSSQYSCRLPPSSYGWQ